MDIKEIALKVARKVDPDFQGLPSDRAACEFAEALIESYKAELLKEIGEPVLYAEFAEDGGWLGDASEYADHLEEPHALFTSDQVAAAVAKATKPLEDQLVAAQEENGRYKASPTVETCRQMIESQAVKENKILFDQLAKAEQLWQVAQGRCDGLEEKLAKAEQRYLAWEGGEEWEQLAFQLCADECGEESCNELIWEGCPPEPWGDRWLKYESEAKRIIQLVRQYAPDKKAEQRVAAAIVDMLQQKHRNCFGAHSFYLAASVATANGEWRKFVKEV